MFSVVNNNPYPELFVSIPNLAKMNNTDRFSTGNWFKKNKLFALIQLIAKIYLFISKHV